LVNREAVSKEWNAVFDYHCELLFKSILQKKGVEEVGEMLGKDFGVAENWVRACEQVSRVSQPADLLTRTHPVLGDTEVFAQHFTNLLDAFLPSSPVKNSAAASAGARFARSARGW
jgi:hypothetical protein